ncbi:hypothetical protein DQ04_02311070 [Trypanosoma grayi]|uniref:hypothetical protein n=1 Tax=Trypanosoma grayi TaxID=71804 RepID=UPI0004F4B322|nr:hypothetical protein DQ04_02311070 [Trypanosoma grayi]KEG11755.1 hypothetical protein DQ04_02311070 [Trypanosoma grayi]
MHATASWNHLLPEHPTSAPVATRPKLHCNTANREHVDGTSGADMTLSEWEAEAIRRYRTLRGIQTNVSSQCEYLSSSATHASLLQLILHSKLLPIQDWRESAWTVASWFQGHASAPLGLLSYAVTDIVLSHEIEPCSAARWVLDISKALLSKCGTPASCATVSYGDWAIAEELERSAYTLQTRNPSVFASFSSVLLNALMDEVIASTDKSELWGLLPLCFLLKRNKGFALSVWTGDEQRYRTRVQSVCELGRVLPTHVAAVLSAVV